MATPPLRESLELARARGDDPARCGFDLCRHIIIGVKESRAARPDLCLKYGGYLLSAHPSSMSQEVWGVYEQVYIALLQHARQDSKRVPADASANNTLRQAQDLLTVLSAQFPDSLRVKRLEGMMWESKGEMDLAMSDYDEILADDPSNILVIKRQVAICRSRGKLGDAAKRLVEYLKTFCSDAEAWLMLHEIYLTCQQYKRAAFCMEEQILINPMSYICKQASRGSNHISEPRSWAGRILIPPCWPLTSLPHCVFTPCLLCAHTKPLHTRHETPPHADHLRAGEMAYTIGMSERSGSNEQLFTSRKYFAHALELKPDNNLRALYGMLLVCSALGTSSKGQKGVKVDTADLVAYLQPLVVKCYSADAAKPHPMRPLAMALMKQLMGRLTASPGA